MRTARRGPPRRALAVDRSVVAGLLRRLAQAYPAVPRRLRHEVVAVGVVGDDGRGVAGEDQVPQGLAARHAGVTGGPAWREKKTLSAQIPGVGWNKVDLITAMLIYHLKL